MLRTSLLIALTLFLFGGSRLQAGTWTRGTGLFNDITLGALENTSVVQRNWPQVVNYDLDLNSWRFDVFVPESYDGTKPYGVMVYITSDSTTGIVLQNAPREKNLIWIAPRHVGNNANSTNRYGAGLLAIHRAKELFNIDPRRIYNSGKSGGARTASGLAFYHSEIFRGTAPSAGFSLPRLDEVTPDYIPNTSGQSDAYFDYSDQPFLFYYLTNNSLHNSIYTTAKARKLRSYIIGRYGDYREDYFVEAFHCAYEPQGLDCFLYNGPGGHADPSDAEMAEAIDYLDRDDTFPVNANIMAGAGGFSGMTNISQSGATALEATSGNGNNATTTYTLTPTLTAVAAAKTASTFYWDNANGSTVRWLWEVKNATPTNQKTSFGLWFANETWGGGAPTSVTTGSNPGILITITQNGTQNRMIVSARPDTGGETIFYDGDFSFVPAYSTAWTSTQTGYLTGTGSPVEIRMDLNQKRWQLTFNGIKLDGTTRIRASGTEITRDNKRMIYGYWDSALGRAFWKHDPNTSALNTWSATTKSIFTAATGALSGTGTAPSPLELRYVIASDPGLPDPLDPGPTGITASAAFGTLQLTWNAFAGATSYHVKRSTTSGGPYTILASNVTATSYTDAGAQSGTLYYYTVSAVTASGTTANGTESSAGLNPLRIRSTGGTASSGQNTTGAEGADKAFDGSTATKWFNGTGATDWLQYRFGSGKRYPLSQYKISSANDSPTRDPVSWQVLGSNDGVNWTTLDTRTGQSFAARFQTNTYNVPVTAAYEYYRLNITANGGATGIQLSEWQILSADLTAPVIATPADILIGTANSSGETVTFTATATDDEDGAVTVVCTPASGSVFPIGSTTVVCRASDSSGNYSQTSFTVSVNDDTQGDTTPPVITVPADIAVPATGPSGATVTFTTSALDAVDGARPTTNTPASGSVFPVGTTVITTTASDTSGNTASRTFTVTVQPFAQARAWLKLDETSGTTAADATGNNWTGTLVGGPTWVAGKLNNAVSLSGSTQYVTLPTGVVNGLTTCTISTWVNLNAVTNWARLFDFGSGTNNYMFLAPRNAANGKLRFAIRTATVAEQIIDGTAVLPTGGWQHVAVVLNGATGTLYVNGVQVGQNTAMTLTPSSLGATSKNYLGKSQFNDPYLSGLVDDFQIFGQALTAQQVAALATPPAAPTSVTANAGNAEASLSWDAVAGAISYNVKRALVSGGPYAFVANTTATSFTDTGLTNGTTYYYVVTALNAATESLNSTEASVSTIPAAPTDLASSGSGTQVSLSWSASTGATAYNVKRSITSGGLYSAVASDVTATSYTDTGLIAGSTYYYVVTATNPTGESSASAETSTTLVPAAPGSLSANGWNGAVDLSWSNASGATSYSVKRATTSGGAYVTLATGVTSTTYSDTTAVNGTTYYYVVSASNAGGESTDSAEASTTFTQPVVYLKFDDTTGTTATDSSGNGWTGTLVNGPLWTAGRSHNTVDLDGSNDHVTLPTGVVSSLTNVTISLWVNLDAISTWSRLFDFGTGTTANMFLTPRNGNNSRIRFAITTGGGSAEQRIDGIAALPIGGWRHVAVTLSGSTGTLYVDGVQVGQNTAMTLKPSSLGNTTQNRIGRSQYNDPYLMGRIDEFRIYSRALSSAEVVSLMNTSPAGLVPAPAALTATAGSGQVVLNWSTVSGATSYDVMRTTTSGGLFTAVATGLSATTYTNTGLTAGTTYYYVIVARTATSESPNSPVASATAQ